MQFYIENGEIKIVCTPEEFSDLHEAVDTHLDGLIDTWKLDMTETEQAELANEKEKFVCYQHAFGMTRDRLKEKQS